MSGRFLKEGFFSKTSRCLEVTAPIIQAQIVETFIINQLHLQTLDRHQSRALRPRRPGRPVVDFALRRTHGTDAGMKVARASYLAGFAGTSNVMAGQRLWHSASSAPWRTRSSSSFEREIDAFRAYVASFPRHAILLIDTYDTLAGARNAVQVAKEMAARGQKLIGVRIDSGDLGGTGARRCAAFSTQADLTGGEDHRQRRLGRI